MMKTDMATLDARDYYGLSNEYRNGNDMKKKLSLCEKCAVKKKCEVYKYNKKMGLEILKCYDFEE